MKDTVCIEGNLEFRVKLDIPIITKTASVSKNVLLQYFIIKTWQTFILNCNN